MSLTQFCMLIRRFKKWDIMRLQHQETKKKKINRSMPIISEPVLLSSPYRNNDSIEFVIDTDECLPD